MKYVNILLNQKKLSNAELSSSRSLAKFI